LASKDVFAAQLKEIRLARSAELVRQTAENGDLLYPDSFAGAYMDDNYR